MEEIIFSLIHVKTLRRSRPINIAKKTTTTIRSFIANFINFQTTTTTRISPINNAQRGTTTPKNSIYTTIILILDLAFKHFHIHNNSVIPKHTKTIILCLFCVYKT